MQFTNEIIDTCVTHKVSKTRRGYIYLTTCTVNGCKYIGQRRPPRTNDRWYLGSGIMIQRAIRKHGKENFKKEILVEGLFNDALLNELERHYIQLHAAVKRTDYYNLCAGGSLLDYNRFENPSKPKYTKIYQWSKDGNLIAMHPTVKDAVLTTGISKEVIARACKLNSFSTKYSCYFSTSSSFENVKEPFNIAKPVFLFDKNGSLVAKFNSISACAKYLNTSNTHVSNSIRSCSFVKGFFISFTTDVQINLNDYYPNGRKKRPIKEKVKPNPKKVTVYLHCLNGEILSYTGISLTEIGTTLGLKKYSVSKYINQRTFVPKLNGLLSKSSANMIVQKPEKLGIPVSVFDANNNWVGNFKNMAVASRILGLNHNSVCRAYFNKVTIHGFRIVGQQTDSINITQKNIPNESC